MPAKAKITERPKGIKSTDQSNIIEAKILSSIFVYYTLYFLKTNDTTAIDTAVAIMGTSNYSNFTLKRVGTPARYSSPE